MNTDTDNEQTENTGFADNPAALLESVYTVIYERQMQDVPVVNPALQVEAIGFCEWEGQWLGILLTPWFMNLLVIPRAGSPWPKLQMGKGKELMLSFPQGVYKFSARQEAGIGSYLSCSLASPVQEWKSQTQARQTAESVLALLKSIPLRPLTGEQAIDAGDKEQGQEVESDNSNSRPQPDGCDRSRRAFLGAARC